MHLHLPPPAFSMRVTHLNSYVLSKLVKGIYPIDPEKRQKNIIFHVTENMTELLGKSREFNLTEFKKQVDDVYISS
jgi:hypothetical protein